MPRKPDAKRYCRNCRAKLRRKMYGSQLESNLAFSRRKFCDQACMLQGWSKRKVGKQGYLWRARKHRKATCERCQSIIGLQVHHKNRDWTDNRPENLETLCASCHRRLHWMEDGQRERRRTKMQVPIRVVEELIATLRRLAPLLPENENKNLARLAMTLRGAPVP